MRWDLGPIDELLDYILIKFHAGLQEELPRLEAMARKVANVHGVLAGAPEPMVPSRS